MLNKPVVRMPELVQGQWLNVQQPLTRDKLKGSVVLVDFWDYSCLNCIRTLPYLRLWHERYSELGLTIIGIHSPEFGFGRSIQNINDAVGKFGVRYPVLLDNGYQNWDRFANRAWPTKYLVDKQGYIRYEEQGEGGYQETEAAIQTLLNGHNLSVNFPEVLPPLREEDSDGAVCFRPTPELYAGYRGGGLFGNALGNEEGYVTGSVMAYRLPPKVVRQAGYFYLEGFWQAGPEAFSYAGKDGGRVVVPYQAAGVNAVLSPSDDEVALMLGLWEANESQVIEITHDGEYLSEPVAGTDVEIDSEGVSTVRVTIPRMYELVKNQGFESHELALTFRAKGIALYTFSFSSCLAN